MLCQAGNSLIGILNRPPTNDEVKIGFLTLFEGLDLNAVI